MLGSIKDAIIGAVVGVVNALVAALGAAVSGLISLLPELPDLPEPPDSLVMAEGWVAWVFPVGTVVSILAWTLTVWLLWQAIALALRWAKMIGD